MGEGGGGVPGGDMQGGNLESQLSGANGAPDLNAVGQDLLNRANAGGEEGIPGRAGGGPVEEQAKYWVGEKGPEVFIPDTDGIIYPANKLPPMDRPASPEQLAEQWREELRKGLNKNPMPTPYNPNIKPTKVRKVLSDLPKHVQDMILKKVGNISVANGKNKITQDWVDEWIRTNLVE
jgi:hypothetical protein